MHATSGRLNVYNFQRLNDIKIIAKLNVKHDVQQTLQINIVTTSLSLKEA